MKKFYLLLVFLPAYFFSLTNTASANVYASGIKISDDTVLTYDNAGSTWDGDFSNGGVKIWFIINEDGVGTLTANITIMQGSNIIRTLNVPSPAKGINSIVWNGYDNSSSAAPLGSYAFEINVFDPVGHTTFDSLWVAGAHYQGNDFDGGTSFAYRGTASISNQSSTKFGNIYVARGTSSANGLYELRADGNYVQKIGTNPEWAASTPNELQSIGENIYGLAGYDYPSGGFVRGFSAATNTEVGTGDFGTTNVRGLVIKIVGSDTIFYSARSGSGLNPAIIMKTGINGDTSTFINMKPYISGTGYIKSFIIDDGGQVFVAFGESSGSRKKLAVFKKTGDFYDMDSTDGKFHLSSSAIISSLVQFSGDPTTEVDDTLFAIVASSTPGEAGIYQLCNQLCFLKPVITPTGITTSGTAEMLGKDPAGNVIWSNGSVNERIISFSPATGPNSFITANPEGMDIVVNTVLPVELTSFSAELILNKVQLKWSTASEINNKGFEIEKKFNGAWEMIGFISGSGSATERKNYSFTDKQISSNGKVYYRLKQIDYDGTFKYSVETGVDISIVSDFALEQNFPNPFNPTTKIKYTIPVVGTRHALSVQLKIYDILGKEVALLINEEQPAGNYEVEFNASALASGTYIYRLTSDNLVITKKMLLLK